MIIKSKQVSFIFRWSTNFADLAVPVVRYGTELQKLWATKISLPYLPVSQDPGFDEAWSFN